MTWEDELFGLFDDLESQASASFTLEREAELADRRRAEYQQVTLAARLMASLDREITLDINGVGLVDGVLERVATGWLLLRGRGQDWVVREAAVSGVRGASERAVPDVAWPVAAKLGLGSALRRLADAAERCVFHGTGGQRWDGVVQRVGADFVEVAVGEPAQVVLIAFATLAAVQSRD
ncbi:hypothetical protein SAMN04487968_101306 [Nocardioides terrae]|uniref:Uncharacterized protein n=1 Tax=Nocardioides terrae TaxID=574651 RepID=A0A1I1DL60_9ACTN|nr:hypothetical protein [Nocardioides terrae]SFB75092.1 hypothetical protein SAMN04487968_101306 [Nocardioides terrae]